MYVIAADVGGTKTRLAFADAKQPRNILYEARYLSGEFDGFESMLHAFIKDGGSAGVMIDVARADVLTLALPGLVSGSSACLTNLPWTIEKQSLEDAFGIENIYFMNDFQASAFGTGHLLEKDKIVLHSGVLHLSKNSDRSSGNVVQNPTHNTRRVAVGAGTGLGVAWVEEDARGDKIMGDKKTMSAHDTEGGHIDFAPIGDIQIQLLQFLQQRFAHVSYERILSGDGLVSLYQFCAGKPGTNVYSDSITAQWVNNQAENDEVADRALSLFVQIYGAYIGNIALLFKPYGGIFITGGIAAKMVKRMQSEEFIHAYLNKGRMQTLVEQIAVYLVTNERVGVLGAMSQAMKKQHERLPYKSLQPTIQEVSR